MTIFLFIKQAISSIFANKLRSFLSTLGIMIGISSFVIMLAIGEGAKESMLKNFSRNANVLQVQASHGKKMGNIEIFTLEVQKEIVSKVPMVSKVFPFYSTSKSEMTFYKGKDFYSSLKALSPGYMEVKKMKLLYGTGFGQDDYDKKRKHIILGNSILKETFKEENPVGKEITIGGQIFYVIGVLDDMDYEVNSNMYIPDTLYKSLYPDYKIQAFEVYVDNEKVVDEVKKNLKYFLQKKVGATKKEKSLPFQVNSNKDTLKQMNDFSKKFTYLLGGIGAIALIVGGIGIMNIMLVSVTERTREIGIRKAIGATNKNILMQFLIESVILTLLGSAIAVGFSYGVTIIVTKLNLGFVPIINNFVLLIAVIVATVMGVTFGLMPAYKAARLKPIDALHFE